MKTQSSYRNGKYRFFVQTTLKIVKKQKNFKEK